MHSKLGYNPSFACQSIANSRDMLEPGLVWRVRNGEDIRIWKDCWLLSPSPPRIQSLPRGIDPDSRVSALIDRATGWWNYSLLHELFDQEDVEQIGMLALSPLNLPDKLIWCGMKNGEFSVRSAYHMGMQQRSQEMGESSSAGIHQELWKLVWKLPSPPVLKNFVWKVGNDLLPTNARLVQRHIRQDPLCPICL